MEINLSEQQFETLLKVVYLGDWMVNAIREPGSYVPEFQELEQFLLSHARDAGFDGVVEFDPALSQFFLTEEFHEMLQPFIDEYDDEAFWDVLVDRLADRDFAETYGKAAKHMDQEERFEKRYVFVDKYETEVEQNGVNRLRIIEEQR
jgi:hypothetical protein